MVDPTLPLPGLSPVAGKEVVARFDGGLLVMREIERRLGIAERLAACIDDPRDPASTAARKADRSVGKVRRFKEFYDAAGSWRRVRRIVTRIEAGKEGADSRFIVTNLGHGSGCSLYQDLYCRRGQAENHIKECQLDLFADRTSTATMPPTSGSVALTAVGQNLARSAAGIRRRDRRVC